MGSHHIESSYSFIIKMNKIIIGTASILSLSNALVKDTCQKGSDAECARFGNYMCCAKIQYTFQQDFQSFYGCASRPGIAATGGVIYDDQGFSGSWSCAEGIALTTSTLILALGVTALNLI